MLEGELETLYGANYCTSRESVSPTNITARRDKTKKNSHLVGTRGITFGTFGIRLLVLGLWVLRRHRHVITIRQNVKRPDFIRRDEMKYSVALIIS